MRMNWKCVALVALEVIAVVGSTQSLPQYLALRKKYGISAAAGAPALDTVIGSRILEISGTVTGSITRKGQQYLILANGENRSDEIQASFIPDWLVGNDIPARLIVSAKHNPEGGEAVTTLLGVAKDEDIRNFEAKAKADEEAAAARAVAKPKLTPPAGKRARRLWSVPMSEATPIYANYIRKVNPRLSVSQAMRIAEALVGFSIQYGVDARLIISMVVAESDFNPSETSSAGAMGLGQLMPGTARDFGISNAYDTTANLYGTVREIHNDLNRYKSRAGNGYENLRLALAAYNAGIGAVARAGGVPNYHETQAYIKRVIKLYYKLCGLD